MAAQTNKQPSPQSNRGNGSKGRASHMRDAIGPRRSVAGRTSTPLIVIILVAILVVVLGVSIGILLALGTPEDLFFKKRATETTEQAVATEENAQPQEAAPETPQPDPRDADFAVDPARTEWNWASNDTPTAYLTFDDGPSENTQAVLDILDAYGIKATFFVTGINPDYYPMIAECYRRGHTIGLHSASHVYEGVYASPEAYWSDLNLIGEIVRQQIGYVPCFIRFPGGSSNTISADYTPGIMTQLSEEVQAAGYQYYDWDVSCGDGAVHTADELVAATMAEMHDLPTNFVFLIHDGAGKQTSVEALPRIIDYFISEGYLFAPIDRTTRVCHHGISN